MEDAGSVAGLISEALKTSTSCRDGQEVGPQNQVDTPPANLNFSSAGHEGVFTVVFLSRGQDIDLRRGPNGSEERL